MSKEKPKDLVGKKIEGIVSILRSDEYKGHRIIIRRIYKDYFEYLVSYEGQIYSSYIIITPEEGKDELTDEQVSECSALIYNGALTTIDMLISEGEVSEEDKEIAELFESRREEFEEGKEDA